MLGLRDLPRLIMTLCIGAIGGAIFAYFRLPLAWMIGAMAATTPLAVMGLGLRMDSRLRMAMIVVLGIMIGGAFAPSVVADAGRWWVSVLAMGVFVVAVGALVFAYFRLVAGFDARTAIFSCLPGGLNEMAVMGRAMGADDRMISLAHSVRIFVVVMSVPFIFQAMGWYERGVSATTIYALGDARVLEIAKICAGSLAGLIICRVLRFPSPILIGAMFGSALIHGTGLSTEQLPTIFIILAQIVIGSAIGTRFAGLASGVLWRAVRHALVTTVLMIAATFAVAALLARLTGFEIQSLLLAFAPGGFAEMTLIALALNVDTAYVSTHHIFRILLIVLVVPILVRVLDQAGMFGPDLAEEDLK